MNLIYPEFNDNTSIQMKIRSIILFLAGAFAGAAPIGRNRCGLASDQNVTVKGEVIDMVCYTDSGASGKDHADCAKTCISEGLPVGLRAKTARSTSSLAIINR